MCVGFVFSSFIPFYVFQTCNPAGLHSWLRVLRNNGFIEREAHPMD